MTAVSITPGYARVLQRRVPLKQTLHDISVMAYRSLLKIKRTPEQFFDVTLQPIIFTGLFPFLFGGAITGSVASFLPMFVPAILVQTVLTATAASGTQLRDDMDKGVFDRLKSLPISRVSPLAGALLADTVRYSVAAAITFAMGLLMGYRPGGGVFGVLGAMVLVIACGWAMSWMFALLGVNAKSAAGVQGLSFLIMIPLTFLSNVFVPVETMPGWLQVVVQLNPVSHIVSAARDLANTGSFGTNGWLALLGAAAAVAIFAPLTVRKYRSHAD
jgi:ABC-2 type transport system permease protein